jgi:phage terminase large subunit-like protein
MGLHGRYAKTKDKKLEDQELAGQIKLPWDNVKLTRSERVIKFIEDLTITSGTMAGEKLVLRKWQRDFIETIYGTKGGYHPRRVGRPTLKELRRRKRLVKQGLPMPEEEDYKPKRKIRTAILSMGRKNGKTQLAAALALCHLCGPESESRGEVYSCANDRFQAGKIFNEMYAMIRQHKWLEARCNVSRFKKEIEDMMSGSVYNALSSEVTTKMGLNPSFVVYDELGQSSSRELYDAMDSAMGARREPLLLVISTQAATDLAPMSMLIDYGKRVHSGEIRDAAFHMTLYAADDDDDPWEEKTWRKANPALDDFRSLEDVKRLAIQAQRMPAQENSFRNLILNQRVAAETRFVEQSAWKACNQPPSIPPGVPVYCGLDLGHVSDLTALVVVWEDTDSMLHVVPHIWIPGDVRAKSDLERAPYEQWVREGHMYAAGETTDPRVVAKKLAEIHSQNKVINCSFDRWRMAEMQRALDDIGCKIEMAPFGQGFKDMTPAVDTVERLIIQKRIRHGNHPVLTFCVSNAVVIRDPAGGRKFDKAKSTGKIDALVALAMAAAACLVKPKEIDIAALIA